MNKTDLRQSLFIVMTHAENCRCEDLHHKPSNRHGLGEECKAVAELQAAIGNVRVWLNGQGLYGC